MATSDNKTADTDEKIFIGKGEQTAWLTLALANRHGLVTGATGTGKTVSLQVMAEGFARAGVPVFAADIKGDLSGISEVGEAKDFIVKRAGEMGLDLPARPVLDRVLGRVRRAGPSGPRHRHGNGAVAAVADARSERRPGGRAQCRVPCRGRERPDADRYEGSPRAAGRDRPGYRQEGPGCRRRPAGADPQSRAGLWQRHQGHRRNHSAPASGAGEPGRNEILRRAGVDAEGFHEDRQRRPRHGQYPGRRQADAEPAPLRDLPVVDAVGAVRRTAGGRRPAEAETGVLLRRGASVVHRCAEGA